LKSGISFSHGYFFAMKIEDEAYACQGYLRCWASPRNGSIFLLSAEPTAEFAYNVEFDSLERGL
jgi:hypothetical protein